MTHTHKPIYHLTGRNACQRRIPDRDESITREGLSTRHGDKVCRCGDRRERDSNHFTSRPQPMDLQAYDKWVH